MLLGDIPPGAAIDKQLERKAIKGGNMAGAKTIVCFGDSNTHGYNNKNGKRFSEHVRWPMVLQELLGEEYLVREEGLSGRTTVFEDPLYEGLSGVSMIRPILLTHEPVSLLIIMLGTNDVKERFSATAENISRGLERLIRKAQSVQEAFTEEKPKILIITPYPIDPEYKDTIVGNEMGKDCCEKSKAIIPLYEAVAKRTGCAYLSAQDIPGVENYPYDYMHLSPEAHKALAEHLAQWIPDYFSEEGK